MSLFLRRTLLAVARAGPKPMVVRTLVSMPHHLPVVGVRRSPFSTDSNDILDQIIDHPETVDELIGVDSSEAFGNVLEDELLEQIETPIPPQAQAHKAPEPHYKRLFVTGIPLSADWLEVKEHFEAHSSKVAFVDMIRAKEGYDTGSAIVKFVEPADALWALENMGQFPMNGHSLDLRFAQPNSRERAGNSNDDEMRRVFVFGIPTDVEWSEVKDHFKVAGPVVYVSVKRDPDTNAGLGYGFVEFQTEKDARWAIQNMHHHPLHGNVLQVQESHQRAGAPTGPKPPKGSQTRRNAPVDYETQLRRRVFVSGLPTHIDWRELKDHFKVAGPVKFAHISRDFETNESRGFGVVEFDEEQDAQWAIENMVDHPLDGYSLSVREDRGRRKN